MTTALPRPQSREQTPQPPDSPSCPRSRSHAQERRRPPRGRRALAWASVALLLAGCAAGPDYHAPQAPAVQRYTREVLPSQTASADVADGKAQHWVQGMKLPEQWWTLFRSEPLNRLVEQALKNNPTPQAAEAALRIAQENVRAQRALYLPQAQVSVSPSRRKDPVGTVAPALTSGVAVYNLYTAQLAVGYTPDVFGGNRRQVESLEAQADQQRYQLEAAYLSLTSNVVAAAIQEAGLRGQIAATEKIIAIQQEQLGIFHKQLDLGAIAQSDVTAQEAQLAQTQATLPVLRKQLALQRDALTALLGRMPADEPDEQFSLDSLQLPESLPVALPSDLVQQRPDVRAAEAALHSASAQIGVAAANMLPQFTLTGALGGTSTSFGQLFNAGNVFWALAGNVAQTVFDGGALQARKRAAVDNFDQAAAQYRSTVIQAFQNVADSMRALQFDADALAAQVRAERAASQSMEYTRKAVQLGSSGYLALLTAQQTYQTALTSLEQARANRLADTAALFQALGGGWWQGTAQAAPAVKAPA